jgi:hypothetical protein
MPGSPIQIRSRYEITCPFEFSLRLLMPFRNFSGPVIRWQRLRKARCPPIGLLYRPTSGLSTPILAVSGPMREFSRATYPESRRTEIRQGVTARQRESECATGAQKVSETLIVRSGPSVKFTRPVCATRRTRNESSRLRSVLVDGARRRLGSPETTSGFLTFLESYGNQASGAAHRENPDNTKSCTTPEAPLKAIA